MVLFRRWRKKFVIYCAGAMTFMTMWSFLTLLILAAQDQFISGGKDGESGLQLVRPKDDYMGRGIQVVVGHFNGKYPEKSKVNFTKEELDQNNYSPIPEAGDHGRGVQLNPEEEELANQYFKINQFSLYASDLVPLNRSLPDVRKRSCKTESYPSELPTTSVIIVYHNEAWSTLLRTVTSVANRSPPSLLREIILVDDASQREFLGDALDEYVATLEVSVKVLRARERVGLIRARLMGAAEARGDVLTFLDSHCECTHGWLEPLLTKIKEDRRAVVCPVIDVINDRTFAYQRGIELFRGGFNWNLQFRWYGVPHKILKDRPGASTKPILSPTMAGGLFSIDKKYFEEIGRYDHNMDIWGGENLEISFRIWMCGGSIQILPCSHVGHVFRKASPHDFPDHGSSRILNSNLVRVAEVWMDEWKHLFYKTAPHAMNLAKNIDVSDRLELRRKLGCKNFRWYLENVWTDHFLPMEHLFFGRVRNENVGQCLQLTYVLSTSATGREKRISVEPCADNFNRLQLWIFDAGSIKGDEHQCLSATKLGSQWLIQLKECGDNAREKWDYSQYKQTLVHRESRLCLDLPLNVGAKDEVKAPSLNKCGRDRGGQRWTFLPVSWKPV